MNGWVAEDIKKDGSDQAVAADAASQVVSNPARVTYGGATHGLRIDVVVGDVTGGGSTFVLQHSAGVDGAGAEGWVAVAGKTVTINSSNAIGSIVLHEGVAADAALLPLKTRLRVVANHAAGGTSVVKAIRVMQEQ